MIVEKGTRGLEKKKGKVPLALRSFREKATSSHAVPSRLPTRGRARTGRHEYLIAHFFSPSDREGRKPALNSQRANKPSPQQGSPDQPARQLRYLSFATF